MKDYLENLIMDINKNKQKFLHTLTSLMVLQENKKFYLPKQIKEKVIETLTSINKDPKSINSYHITKILRELANDGILENIKTKKKIKESGLSKDFRKAEIGRRRISICICHSRPI